MSAKKIVIKTDKQSEVFKVSESGGWFYAYKDGRKLGESKSMEDAIQIIKASVGGSVREIKMSDW